MRYYTSACLVACAALLAACGGGGGGGGSSPAPIVPLPTTPPATFDIANLTSDQTFEAIGNNQNADFDLAQGQVMNASSQNAQLSVAYDAASKRYTVSLGSESASFGAGDVTSNANGEVRYETGNSATGRQLLTLVTTPYSGGASNKYVGLGYWQRYSVTNQVQEDTFSTFVYGQRTPVSGTPKTGTAQYAIDVFGVASTVATTPIVFEGDGYFSVDFLGGEFFVKSQMSEYELLTGNVFTGGGMDLTSSGYLTSGSGNFSGLAVVKTRFGTTTGDLNGSFFGPEGQEIGASFATRNANGDSAVGSFTGKSNGQSGVNLNLANIITPQTYSGGGVTMYYETGAIYGTGYRTEHMAGVLRDQTKGAYSYAPAVNNLTEVAYTEADKVQGTNANFTDYLKTVDGHDVRLQLYKVGNANSELKLSYVSMGRWERASIQGPANRTIQHFYYGLETPENALNHRTGSARYEGVAYGVGGHGSTGDQYDVTGSSAFDINFGSQSYTGLLVLNGHRNGNTVAFGSYDFNGQLVSNYNNASFADPSGYHGDIAWKFYGPTGEEIGGQFWVRVPEDVFAGSMVINGVTVARRR